MVAMRRLSITLPTVLADLVQSRIASGAYASESEVIQEGLLMLEARDHGLEAKLRQEVMPAFAAMMADPSLGIPMDESFDRVEARLAARMKREG